jgi:antitoxin VapB
MSVTAKIFKHGRSQAVRLPKEFRFEGTEVRVSKIGDKVILEPLKKPPFDVEAWFARLDELGGRDFLPEGSHRHERWDGMRWTRQRQARDVIAGRVRLRISVSGRSAQDE